MVDKLSYRRVVGWWSLEQLWPGHCKNEKSFIVSVADVFFSNFDLPSGNDNRWRSVDWCTIAHDGDISAAHEGFVFDAHAQTRLTSDWISAPVVSGSVFPLKDAVTAVDIGRQLNTRGDRG